MEQLEPDPHPRALGQPDGEGRRAGQPDGDRHGWSPARWSLGPSGYRLFYKKAHLRNWDPSKLS